MADTQEFFDFIEKLIQHGFVAKYSSKVFKLEDYPEIGDLLSDISVKPQAFKHIIPEYIVTNECLLNVTAITVDNTAYDSRLKFDCRIVVNPNDINSIVVKETLYPIDVVDNGLGEIVLIAFDLLLEDLIEHQKKSIGVLQNKGWGEW